MDVGRVATVAQNDLWGGRWSRTTVADSIGHVSTARTAYRGHITNFELDKCVLDIRCNMKDYAT